MIESPNIVLVVLEGVRADHLSCEGYARETTPVLDSLARGGVRFARAFSPSPSTLPAHASIWTGRHPISHGATEETPCLQSRHPTLPERFRAAGYRTGAFCADPVVSPATGFGPGFDRFVTQDSYVNWANRAVTFGRRAADRLLRRSDAGARRTNRAFDRWLGSSKSPFLAFLHYAETGWPLRVPPPCERLFLPGEGEVERAQALVERLSANPEAVLDAEERELLRGLYDGALRYADQRVGELVELLRERGLWEKTLLVVTSDHGVELGRAAATLSRSSLSDGWLRVPLLLHGPGRVPAGFVVEELAQLTDLLPTMLAVAGMAEGPEPLPGRALIRDGGVTPGPEFVVAESFRSATKAGEGDPRPVSPGRAKMLRTRREKFVWHSDEKNEFYDLVADPGECANRISSDPDRGDALRRRLFDWLAKVERFDPTRGVTSDAMSQVAGGRV